MYFFHTIDIINTIYIKNMFIQTEQTPNPQTLKFLPGRVIMDKGTAFFQNSEEANNSPFAKRLF